MKAFITVIGHDTVGVVAKVAGLCTELNINIEDVVCQDSRKIGICLLP